MKFAPHGARMTPDERLRLRLHQELIVRGVVHHHVILMRHAVTQEISIRFRDKRTTKMVQMTQEQALELVLRLPKPSTLDQVMAAAAAVPGAKHL